MSDEKAFYPYGAMDLIIQQIEQAKEKIMHDLVQQIEGRPAVLSDGENFTFVTPQNYDDGKTILMYKDVQLGYIQVKYSVEPLKSPLTNTPPYLIVEFIPT